MVVERGGKSFSNKKCEKRAPFPKSCASYFRFARFNTFPLYYLRAWHRLAFIVPTGYIPACDAIAKPLLYNDVKYISLAKRSINEINK